MPLLADSSSRRSEQDHQAARRLEQEYREHATTLDRYLNGTFGTALSASEREEVRQQAFVGLATEYAKGVEIQSTEAMLITCARNAAYSLLRSADRRRRWSFDPHDSAEARLADTSIPVDVAVVEADEDRRVKMLMAQLDERSRTVLQLRLEFELDAPEIAERLGVSPSHAYKLLKQAGRALADSIAANNEGAHSRQQRALLVACEMGTATDEQRRQAELLRDDPHARVLLAELRGLGHQAAAFMPPIAVAGAAPPSSGRVSHMIASVKQYVTDLAGRAPGHDTASQIAATGGVRGSGAAAVAVLACVGGVTGAAVGVKECIDRGVPAALVDVIPGGNRDDPPPPEPVVEEPVQPPATIPDQDQQIATPTQAARDPEPEAPPARTSEPTPPTASDSLSGLGGDPTPTPAPAPAPPVASGGTGGGGSSGSSGAQFGGL